MSNIFIYEDLKKGHDDVVTEFSGPEEEFDPHKYRKIRHPTTYSATLMHMLIGCLGNGLLAMPNAVSRLGLVFGSTGIIVIGIFATYCIQLLVLAQYQLCKMERRGYMAYAKTMRIAVQRGPIFMRVAARWFGNAVYFFSIFWQIGICAIYFVFVAQNLKQIIDVYSVGEKISVRSLICYCYPFALLMSLIKTLKTLTPFSMISNFCVMIGLMFTFFYLFEDDVEIDDVKLFRMQDIEDIPIFVGINLFALEALGVILALEYNMEKPDEFTGVCGLFSVGMTIILSVYVVLGVSGFLKYGTDCKGSITLNLPLNEKKAQLAKLTFAIALFLSYPLQNLVPWQLAWRLIHKRLNDSPLADYTLRVIIATIPFFMAVSAPNLGAFMGLMGSLCLTMLAMVFPAVMDICVFYPNRYGKGNYKLISDIFIIIFGLFICGSGVYSSLLEMFEETELDH